MSSPFKTLVFRLPVGAAAVRHTSTIPRLASNISASRTLSCLARPSPVRQQCRAVGPAAKTTPIFARHNSNAASAATDSKTAASTTLTWDGFFKLRLRRRRVQLVCSITTGATGFLTGMGVLATGAAEPVVKLIPLDPFLTLGLMSMACGALGWLGGPSVGSGLFYMMNGKLKPQMRLKESEFLEKVRKNRADPANSSAANPVPDFYGEKIQSVSGYRQWLKDQRAFNRKKTKNIV